MDKKMTKMNKRMIKAKGTNSKIRSLLLFPKILRSLKTRKSQLQRKNARRDWSILILKRSKKNCTTTSKTSLFRKTRDSNAISKMI
jgi:hypothetical protein